MELKHSSLSIKCLDNKEVKFLWLKVLLFFNEKMVGRIDTQHNDEWNVTQHNDKWYNVNQHNDEWYNVKSA
jgi:hypothetical protein